MLTSHHHKDEPLIHEQMHIILHKKTSSTRWIPVWIILDYKGSVQVKFVRYPALVACRDSAVLNETDP